MFQVPSSRLTKEDSFRKLVGESASFFIYRFTIGRKHVAGGC